MLRLREHGGHYLLHRANGPVGIFNKLADDLINFLAGLIRLLRKLLNLLCDYRKPASVLSRPSSLNAGVQT